MKAAPALAILAFSTLPALAGMTDTPAITQTSPQPVPATSAAVYLRVDGHDLDPDPTENHSDAGQYWHIWVRTVDSAGKAGAWTLCRDANCYIADGGDDMFRLSVMGKRWLVPGGKFQMHYWKGLSTVGVTDPGKSDGGAPVSGWSNIVSWTVNPATASGTIAMAPPPPAPPPPVFKKALQLKQFSPPPGVGSR